MVVKKLSIRNTKTKCFIRSQEEIGKEGKRERERRVTDERDTLRERL